MSQTLQALQGFRRGEGHEEPPINVDDRNISEVAVFRMMRFLPCVVIWL
jgi:hypothetical protein